MCRICMKLFLNSANARQVEQALDQWNIDGVTTDLCLIRDTGKPFRTVIDEICKLLDGTNKTVSVPINPHITDWEEIVDEAATISALSPQVIVRIHCLKSVYKAIPILARKGIRVDVGLVFSTMQAFKAMRSGAYYVSPERRLESQRGDDMRDFINDMVVIRDRYSYKTQLVVSAVGNIEHMVEALIAGVDAVTAPFDLYQEAFNCTDTHDALLEQQACWNSIAREE